MITYYLKIKKNAKHNKIKKTDLLRSVYNKISSFRTFICIFKALEKSNITYQTRDPEYKT